MSFDSDFFDDIFPQPTHAPVHTLGKFQPKARQKTDKVVQPPSSDHPFQDGDRASSMNAPKELHLAEGYVEAPGSPLWQKAVDSDVNICLQGNQEISMEQETRDLTGLEPSTDSLFQASEASEPHTLATTSLGIDGDSGALHSNNAPEPIGNEDFGGHEAMSSDFDLESLDTILSQRDTATDSEAMLPIHGVGFQIDDEGLQGVVESGLSDDIFMQPTSRSEARVVGKFQPKGKPKMKKERSIASVSCGSMVPPTSSAVHPPEAESFSSPLLAFPPDSSTSLNSPADNVLGGDMNAPPMETSSLYNYRELNAAHDTTEVDTVGIRKRKDMEQEPSGQAVDGELQETLDGGGSETDLFDDADVSQTYRQLRKRTSVRTPLDDLGDGDGDVEQWGVGGKKRNNFETVEEESDDDYMAGGLFEKKTPRKPKTVLDEREKLPEMDKHAQFESDSSTQNSQRKKFSHSTRRSRRQVDKVLLETPDEDINPMKLKIKDLIMLAEARERISIKEAAKTGQPGQDQSFANDMNRGGDDADQPVQISSTKLNYHTYMNKPRSERWSKMETELFYQAVRQFGTDFAMIQQLLPNRTRHQIKLKFKNEERKHPLQIADAVVHRSKDHSQFELVIERLKAQEKESMNSVDTAADPAAESQATGAENEEEEGGKSGDKKEELEVDDWDQQVDDPEDQDVFDWSQYDIPDSSPTYGADKSQYNEMF